MVERRSAVVKSRSVLSWHRGSSILREARKVPRNSGDGCLYFPAAHHHVALTLARQQTFSTPPSAVVWRPRIYLAKPTYEQSMVEQPPLAFDEVLIDPERT